MHDKYVPADVESAAQSNWRATDVYRTTETSAKPTPPAPARHNYQVVKDERFTARSLSVEDAVMQLNLLGDELLVFTDAGSGRTSVLYRRKDGNYGLIETGNANGTGTNSGGR